MDVLLWGVRLAHFVLVVILFISVFLNSCRIKEVSLVILVFILFKYLIGYNQCVLTKIEYKILGKENYEKGFIYRFMNPFSNIPENYFNNGLMVFHIIWILILVYQLNCMGCDFFSLI